MRSVPKNGTLVKIPLPPPSVLPHASLFLFFPSSRRFNLRIQNIRSLFLVYFYVENFLRFYIPRSRYFIPTLSLMPTYNPDHVINRPPFANTIITSHHAQCPLPPTITLNPTSNNLLSHIFHQFPVFLHSRSNLPSCPPPARHSLTVSIKPQSTPPPPPSFMIRLLRPNSDTSYLTLLPDPLSPPT